MEDVKKWLVDPNRDYNTGVDIFARYCKNTFLAKSLRNRKDLKKLEYELKKLLGIPLEAIFNQKCSNQQLVNAVPEKEKKVITLRSSQVKKQNIKLPAEIEQAKREIPELYKKIDMMHSDLYDLGVLNTPDVKEKRKRILDKRKPLISHCNRLYVLKEEYFITGKISPELPELLKKGIESNVLITNSGISKLQNLTDIELLKRKSSVASSVTKLTNKLNYQSISKLPALRPLPVGPERSKIERKLKTLRNEQKEIYKLIECRNGKGKSKR